MKRNRKLDIVHLAIIPRGHEGERNNCFSKIQLVGKKYRDKTTLASLKSFFAAKKSALFTTSRLQQIT